MQLRDAALKIEAIHAIGISIRVTCHDAHEDARLDASHYEAVCLSCHGGKAGVQAFRRSGVQGNADEHPTPNAQHLISGRPCPVNPRSGYIACHMPNREVVRGISMADHWIRVVRASQEPGRQ